MICPNCKAIIDDNSRFCTACGFHITPQEKPAIKYNAPDLGFPSQPRQTPVKPVPNYTLQEQDSRTIILPDDQRGIVTPIGAPAQQAAQPNYGGFSQNPPIRKKKNGAKIAAIVSAVVVLLVAACVAVVLLFTVQTKSFVTDADNGKIFTGCDGYGSVADDASGVFDTFALYKSLGGEVFGTENEADFLSLDVADVKKSYSYSPREIESVFTSYKSLKSAVKIKYSSDDNIKNGETEKFYVSIDTDKINSLGFAKKLIGKNEFEVSVAASSLPQAVDVNAFEFLNGVVYDKTNGEIHCVYNKQLIKNVGDFKITVDGDEVAVKNGAGNTVGTFDLCPDSVISSQKPSEISVKLSCEKEEFAQYGIVFTQTDKKFTVGDCDYTSDITKLNASDLSSLKNAAFKAIQAYHSDAEEEKIYFSYRGEGYTNRLIFTYSYYDSSTGKKLYATVAFTDIKSDSGKNLVTNPKNASTSVTDSMASLKDIEKEYKASSKSFYSVKIQKLN